MAELKEFNGPMQVGGGLEDFSIENNTIQVFNKPSSINYAAYSAVLGSPEQAESTYRSVFGEMESFGSSDTSTSIKKSVEDHRFSAARSETVKALSDPNLSVEEKERIALGYLGAVSTTNPLTNILSDEVLIEASEGETVEAENVRLNTADVIDNVNRHKKEVQKIMNAEIAKVDNDLSNSVISFAELMVPFMEQSNLAFIVNEFREGKEVSPAKAITLMGQARQDIVEGLKKMPPEQRLEVQQHLVDIINNHKGIIFTDDNDFTHLHNLRTVLEEGYYTDVDRWVDNITSLLDLTILGAPAAKAVSRGARGLKKAPSAVRASEPVLEVSKATEEAFSPALKAGQDFEDGWGLEEATHFAGIISNHKGWQASREYLDEFKRLKFEPQPVKEEVFNPVEKASKDFQDGWDIKEATHYAEVISNHKGWKAAREYLEEFKRLDLEPVGKGFDGNTPAFFEVDIESKAVRSLVRSEVSPVSVSQNYKDVNPSKARAAHSLAAADTTEEAALAGYGTTRTNAIANDLLPEAGNNGAVKNKVGAIDAHFVDSITPNPKVMDFLNDNGAIYYFKEEKIKQRARVVNDFKNAFGLHARDEMFNIEPLGDGVRINAIYGPKEGGFSSAESAIELAKFSLRDYGIVDEQIQLLVRRGEDYLPMDIKDLEGMPEAWKKGVLGDFLIGVKHDYKFDPSDVVEWISTDVKRNIFDYIPPLTSGDHGSLQRHILDAHSMLHPTVTLGANASVDKAIGLERVLADIGRDFAKDYAKLPKERRAVIEKVIKEANEKGIDFNYNAMKALGVKDEEMSMLRKWREAWDSIYWLENSDFAKTLTHRGYKMFIDPMTKTEMVAKPVAKRSVPERARVYMPDTDNVVTLNTAAINRLYEEGGTLAQLRTPFHVLDSVAEYVVSMEKPGTSYLRSISPSDQVLTYRKGYYQVHYKDPKFIIKVERDNSGKVVKEQAVATAGSTREANLMATRLKEASEGEFYVRGDVKKVRMDSDEYWDLSVSGGRTAQRVRGKRLEDATSSIGSPSHENILDPVEALTKSIRSVSQRVSMRDYLDATKTRFINQFKDVLPKDDFARPRFPVNRKEIGKPGVQVSREIADARTMYEYIRYIENGYVNAIDDAYKAGLNTLAEVMGKYDSGVASKAEKGLREAANGLGPTALAKHTAFKMYLALNPLRQIVVQSHQAIRLAALFPKYVGTSQMLTDFRIITYGIRGLPIPKNLLNSVGMTEADAMKMVKDFEKSGLFAAVDANNLVRGDLLKLADINMSGKIMHAAAAPIRISQKYGFDAGEQFNIITSWLAHRNEALNKGMKLDAETMDTVSAMARNFTYNMNLAGDMPYNRNALNLVFQFMQVPHKALLQDLTNRAISRKDKAKLLAFDTVMWGAGAITQFGPVAGAIYAIQDEDLRRAITHGLEDYVLNSIISSATGTDTAIDFSDLAPGNMTGIWETVSQIWTTDLGAIIASSPSGQLFFGNNPRLTNAFKDAARYFNLIDDYTEPTEFSDVATSFAKSASGMSNAFKASYALKYGQKVNSLDKVTDYNVTTPEAIAQLFGFRTITEAQNAKVKQEMYETSKQFKEDVTNWYKDLKRHLASTDITRDEAARVLSIQSEAWRVWGNGNVRAQQIVNQLLENDLKNGDDTLFQSLQMTMQYMNPEDTRKLIKDASMPEDKKSILLDVLDYFKNNNEEK